MIFYKRIQGVQLKFNKLFFNKQFKEAEMLKYKVLCVGVSPLLMNPATDELLDQLDGGAGARKPKITDEDPKAKAEKKIIKSDTGQIGVPSEYMFACLVEAGRLIKIDSRRSISTKDSTLLPSFLVIEDTFLPFENQEAKWEVDRRRGMLDNAGKKTAVCITRPKFKEWSFVLDLSVDEKEIAVDKIKNLVEKAEAPSVWAISAQPKEVRSADLR